MQSYVLDPMTSVLHETQGRRHKEKEEMRGRDGEIETSHTEPLRTGRGSKAGSPLRHFRGAAGLLASLCICVQDTFSFLQAFVCGLS